MNGWREWYHHFGLTATELGRSAATKDARIQELNGEVY
jgi:hypothetical protein